VQDKKKNGNRVGISKKNSYISTNQNNSLLSIANYSLSIKKILPLLPIIITFKKE
jgi:hypothetical protein